LHGTFISSIADDCSASRDLVQLFSGQSNHVAVDPPMINALSVGDR
jgi:hypothetical protein